VTLLLLLLLAAPDGGVLLERPMVITADKGVGKSREKHAEYQGHVKVVRDTTTMTCDRLEVLYGAEGGQITRILGHGNVEAVDGDRWAKGEEADFDNLTGVLVVTGHPEARQGKREVVGEVVTFTTGADRVHVTRPKTRLEDEKAPGADKRIAIDADELTLESAKKEAVWKGHVHARRGPTTLTAPELTAFYDDAGEVTRVDARGGVEVTEADRWAMGQFATYDVASGLLVVTGKPQARQGKNRMKGTKVIFRTGSDVIEVEKAETIIDMEKKKK